MQVDFAMETVSCANLPCPRYYTPPIYSPTAGAQPPITPAVDSLMHYIQYMVR